MEVVRRATSLLFVTVVAYAALQDVPEPPRLVNVTCASNEATLHWQPMEATEGTIIGYYIQHSNSFTPQTWEALHDLVPASATRYKIELSPWTNYTFRVLAVSDTGTSPPSAPSAVCSTRPDVPHRNPDNVQGVGTEPDNIVISWNVMPELDHNGPGFVYRVYWKRDVPEEDWSSADIGNWRTHQMVIPDQPVFQKYRIKVAAVNREGETSPPVEVIGYSGEGVPTQAPTNLKILDLTSRKVVLKWDPVEPGTLQGHFKGYKIQTWTEEGGEGDMRETDVWSPTKTRAHVAIVANSRVHLRVLAYNGRNNGPPSEVLSFDSPEGVPGPVARFDAYELGSTAFYLTWEPPHQPNGVLTGYKIYYQTVSGTRVGIRMERKPAISDPQQRRTKLGGLVADTKYRIIIAALTRNGKGEDYFIEHRTRSEEATTPPDTPQFDWYKEALEGGVASIRVVWLPDVEGHPGSYFYVKRRLKGDTKYSETVETVQDYMIVSNLVPCLVYEIVVVTVDGEYQAESEVKQVVVETDDECKAHNQLEDVDSQTPGRNQH